MKLLFSEQKFRLPEHYRFPYVIWAVPERRRRPRDIFDAGFLPSSRELDRFYLCRQIRVSLPKFKPSSENRRIQRKGIGIGIELVPREKYDYTPERREFFKNLRRHQVRQGHHVVSSGWTRCLPRRSISHLLVFTDTETGEDIGTATLYVEGKSLAFYYYAFYDLNYYARNLRMFMMTSAAELFRRARR